MFSASSPQARALGAAMRQAREEKKASGGSYSLRDVAARMQVRYPNISLWETGKKFPTVDEITRFLDAIDASAEIRDKILERFRRATESNWVVAGGSGVSQGVATLINCERTASTIVDWMPLLIPGLLQTSDYTRVIVESEPAVLLRAARRDVLVKPNPVRLLALIGESALTARLGGLEIHLNQLRHLMRAAEADNVSIQVVPSQQDRYHPGMIGPFIFFDFPDSPPIVHLEHHRASVFIHDESDVAEYRAVIDTMRNEVAMDTTPSLEFIAGLIEKLEKEWDESSG